MACHGLSMRLLDSEEVYNLYQTEKLDGCYKLYLDGTKVEINGITLQEIADHYNNGYEFGKEEIVKVELEISLSQEDIDDTCAEH